MSLDSDILTEDDLEKLSQEIFRYVKVMNLESDAAVICMARALGIILAQIVIPGHLGEVLKGINQLIILNVVKRLSE